MTNRVEFSNRESWNFQIRFSNVIGLEGPARIHIDYRQVMEMILHYLRSLCSYGSRLD